MTNPFYNVSGAPVTGSSGSSAVIRSEYALIAAAFDKLPALTASTIVGVNSGGTALTNYTTTGTGTVVVLATSPTITTPAISGDSTFRSGASGTKLTVGIGRTGTEGTVGVAAAANDFQTNLAIAAGDTVIRSASNAAVITASTSVTLGIPNSASIIRFMNHGGATLFSVSGDGSSCAFPTISTTASAANAFLDNASTPANNLLRSTSSLAYKRDIIPLSAEDASAVLDLLQPFTYCSKAAADDPSRRFYGLGAEDVAAVAPALINFTKMKSLSADDPRAAEFIKSAGIASSAVRVADLITGDSLAAEELVADGVQYERVCVLLLAERAQLKSDIAALKAKVGL